MRYKMRSAGAASVLLVLASAVATAQGTESRQIRMPLGDSVGIPCTVVEAAGVSVLRVRNSHSLTIPRRTSIKATYEHWDGFVTTVLHHTVTAEHVLAGDLLPGQSVQFSMPYPMATFGCTAQFDRGRPDLQVSEASLAGAQVKLVVWNASFGVAGASTARVRLMKCSQRELGTINVPVPGVGPNQKTTVLKSITVPQGCQYLDAMADATNAVQERNDANNSFTGVGVCIH